MYMHSHIHIILYIHEYTLCIKCTLQQCIMYKDANEVRQQIKEVRFCYMIDTTPCNRFFVYIIIRYNVILHSRTKLYDKGCTKSRTLGGGGGAIARTDGPVLLGILPKW